MKDIYEKPLVSIIMNCLNGERYLKEAIDSIYNQTYQNWEIIFWDNGSTDNTREIANSYDKKLKYFHSSKTTLLGEARVNATNKASGKYLAFLDCDDLWLDDKLDKQVKLIQQDESALVYGRSEIIFSDGASMTKSMTFMEGQKLPEGMVFKDLILENFIPFLSAIVDKDKFDECGGFPSHFKHATDYWIFLKIAHKYKITAIQDVCCLYRIHNNNLSNFQHVICALEDIEVTKSFFPDKYALDSLKLKMVRLSIAYLREKKYFKAIKNLLENGGWTIFLTRIFKKFLKF